MGQELAIKPSEWGKSSKGLPRAGLRPCHADLGAAHRRKVTRAGDRDPIPICQAVYDNHMAELSKLAGMYSAMVRDAAAPVERRSSATPSDKNASRRSSLARPVRPD